MGNDSALSHAVSVLAGQLLDDALDNVKLLHWCLYCRDVCCMYHKDGE